MTVDAERLKEGAALAQSGQFSQARSIFDEVLFSNPEDTEALFLKGACFYKEGNPSEASDCWKRVLSIDPNHAKAGNMLAKLPAEGGTEISGGYTSPQPTPKPQAQTVKTPEKKAKAKSLNLNFKLIAMAFVVLVIAGFAADMYFNPNSYPFLSKGNAPAESNPGAVQPEAAGKADTPLEQGLAGKWFFLFEGSPSEFNFFPNGRLSVTIKREGGITFNFDGTYKIEGTTIVFSVNTPEGQTEVKAYNAKIVGPDFTFNYDDANGPQINAERR